MFLQNRLGSSQDSPQQVYSSIYSTFRPFPGLIYAITIILHMATAAALLNYEKILKIENLKTQSVELFSINIPFLYVLKLSKNDMDISSTHVFIIHVKVHRDLRIYTVNYYL